MVLTRFVLLVLLSAFSLSTYSCEDQAFSIKPDELKNILQGGGFTGVIDGAEKIEYLGHINNDSVGFQVYYYAREFGNHRLAQRLIFISNDKKYIGMFSVNDKPVSVNGDQVAFEYDEDVGNVIRLTDEGVPQKARLDGEIVELFL